MQLSPKAIRFIIAAIECYQAHHEQRLQDDSMTEDECAALTNDCHYLEAIRTDLITYRHASAKIYPSHANADDVGELTLAMHTNKNLYLPGEEIIITASATRPDQAQLTSHNVQIKVGILDESRGQLIKTMLLRDDGEPPDEKAGDGIYTGSLHLDGLSLGSLLIFGEAASELSHSAICSSRVRVSKDTTPRDT